MFAGLGSSAEGCVMEGTSLLRGAASLGEQNILSLFPNHLGDLQTEKQFANVLAMSHQPVPAAAPPSQPKGLGAKGVSWGQAGFRRALVCRGKLPNAVLVSLVALQDLSLQGQGGGGCDGGAESSGGSADRQDHCQRVFAFLPAQGKRSVRAAVPPGPADAALAPCCSLPCSALQRPKIPKKSPEQRLGLCPQLPVLTGTLGVGNCPITPVFGGFSTRLSIFNTSTLCSPVNTGISSFHTRTPPFFKFVVLDGCTGKKTRALKAKCEHK